MTSTFAPMWRVRKLAFLSLAMSMLEVCVFLCIRMLATHPMSHSSHSFALKKLIAATVLLIGPAAILIAIVGVFFDSRRLAAFIAVFVAVGCWFLSFLQTLV
jgi:hypothetical protein